MPIGTYSFYLDSFPPTPTKHHSMEHDSMDVRLKFVWTGPLENDKNDSIQILLLETQTKSGLKLSNMNIEE